MRRIKAAHEAGGVKIRGRELDTETLKQKAVKRGWWRAGGGCRAEQDAAYS